MPQVSIIVPIYNVEPYVGECLQSLINQTLSDIEIICVDDRGSDKSMSVVRKFAHSDRRIRIVRNWRNRGLSYSRNHGMKYVRAPYIMFCDSDDMFAPDMCEKMLGAITYNHSDVAVCGVQVIYQANHDLKDSDDGFFAIRQPGTFKLTRSSHGICYGTAWGKIYRTDIIRRYKLKFPVGLKHEDEFFWPAYTLWASSITFVAEKLYKYRRRAGSIMNVAYQHSALNMDHMKIACCYFEYCNKNDVFSDVRNWFWGQMFPVMFSSSLRYSGPNNAATCLRYAQNFIDKNYQLYGLTLETQNTIESIKSYIKIGGNTNA